MSYGTIAHLQRTIGNAAVTQLYSNNSPYHYIQLSSENKKNKNNKRKADASHLDNESSDDEVQIDNKDETRMQTRIFLKQ
jgi:hypothetical protein